MEHQSVTAVEWLIEQLARKNNEFQALTFYYDHKEEIEQAKAMEKKQIEIAFSDGQQIPINSQTLPMYSREEYYDDTYGKE
jgi:hypothetical protein